MRWRSTQTPVTGPHRQRRGADSIVSATVMRTAPALTRRASSQQCEGCAVPPAGRCAAATAPAVTRRASRWPVSGTGICVAPPACPFDFGATGHRSSHSDADGTGSDSTCQQAGAPLLSRSPGTSHRAAEHLGDWPGTFTMRASVRPRRAPTKARGARGEAPGAPHQSQGASTWSPTQISIFGSAG